ncbi:MAG: hypothetical protein PUC36_08290 [Clostridiales bacterium]|nr:hypothetical protein [Clostridiales bacterium]
MEIPVRNEAEQRVLQKMEQKGFPGSVKMTVIGALWDEPEQLTELEALLDNGATAREMVKSVQPIMRRALERRGTE